MKKIIGIILVLVMSASCFCLFGCGKTPDSATDLEIYFVQAGSGDEYFKKIVSAFEAKHPEINVVEPTINSDYNHTKNILPSGAKANSIDLMFGYLPKYKNYLEFLEPLDDVINSKYGSENKTIKEKLGLKMSSFNCDGSVYFSPITADAGGLVYNKTLIDKTITDFKLPRTTLEFQRLADNIKSNEVTPFLHNSNGGYWSFPLEIWWAQYSGRQAYNDFWQAKKGETQPSIEVFSDEGRLEALKVLEKLIAPVGYVVDGSNSWTHTAAQTQFVNQRAAFMPNGGWLQNEIKSNENAKSQEILMMKIPVISSLGTKLGISDNVLAAIVDYVDGVSDVAPQFSSSKGITSEKVISDVREARGIIHTTNFEIGAMIPKYSTAKDSAKTFLKFFYSDESLQIIADTLKARPIADFSDDRKLDTSSWNGFQKSHYDYQNSGEYIFKVLNYPLFYKTDLTESFLTKPELTLSAKGTAKKTAQKFLDDEVATITAKWKQYLTISGLN